MCLLNIKNVHLRPNLETSVLMFRNCPLNLKVELLSTADCKQLALCKPPRGSLLFHSFREESKLSDHSNQTPLPGQNQ